MEQKKQAPTPQGTEQGQIKSIEAVGLHNKDTQLSLTPAQRRVYNLLSDGGMYSATDISIQLRICDPRGIIRDLRHSGVEVTDVWVTGTPGVRFKRYFIRGCGLPNFTCIKS